MNAPKKIIRSKTSILPFVRLQYTRVRDNAAKDHIQSMLVGRVIARGLLADLARRQQFDQILVKRMHSLPHRRLHNAVEKMEIVRLNGILHATISPHQFDAWNPFSID